MKKRFSSILLWSVISAAFIGPGTLATATAAGSAFGISLIWSLVFSTGACLLLQEMVARLAINTNKDLLTVVNEHFESSIWVKFIGISVILGCVAYQAGNILGAVSGLQLIFEFNKYVVTLLIGLMCITLLWFGSIKSIVKILGYLVALMGFLFILLSLKTDISSYALMDFAPSIPKGSSFIVLGLIGTTIVPYNLFLGSGIAKGESLSEMRFGLTVSVVFGGVISIAILIVATNLEGGSGFYQVAEYLGNKVGSWAYYFMGFGLFAAGITSSLTAPLAAAIIAKSISSKNSKPQYYRLTWILVMFIGLLFGLLDVKPMPIIIAAQALNGFVLPAVVLLILLLINHSNYIEPENQNGWLLNILGLLVLNIVLLLAMNGLFKIAQKFISIDFLNSNIQYLVYQIISTPFILFTIYKLYYLKKSV